MRSAHPTTPAQLRRLRARLRRVTMALRSPADTSAGSSGASPGKRCTRTAAGSPASSGRRQCPPSTADAAPSAHKNSPQRVATVNLEEFVQSLGLVVAAVPICVDDRSDDVLGGRARLEEMLGHTVLVTASLSDGLQQNDATGGQVRDPLAAPRQARMLRTAVLGHDADTVLRQVQRGLARQRRLPMLASPVACQIG